MSGSIGFIAHTVIRMVNSANDRWQSASIIDRESGEIITMYVFVGVLSYSGLATQFGYEYKFLSRYGKGYMFLS
jgi:hypothetical protein